MCSTVRLSFWQYGQDGKRESVRFDFIGVGDENVAYS